LAERSSHTVLIKDRSKVVPQGGLNRGLDAIIVPAGRRAHRLKSVADLAARAGVLLVVLASHDCLVEEVAELVSRTPGCTALIVQVELDFRHKDLLFDTSMEIFQNLMAGRNSNLSMKRNLGLLLARMLGWRKIMFLDDDIRDVTCGDLDKVALQLDEHQIAGLIVPSFPDNSVVCHASRLSGNSQGVFLTGAALGVNCNDKPLGFFPNIYNEDWFFFAVNAADDAAICVGDAHQQGFNPYANPKRAATEEFGDVIAEGLYALFDDGYGLDAATLEYWEGFTASRRAMIVSIQKQLATLETHEAVQAQKSIQEAQFQLDFFSAQDCFDFVNAWRKDRGTFSRAVNNIRPVKDLAAAFDYLGLHTWRQSAFGLEAVPQEHLRGVPTPQRRRSSLAPKAEAPSLRAADVNRPQSTDYRGG